MSNAEHLIENLILGMRDGKMPMDILEESGNLMMLEDEFTGITSEEAIAIACHVVYGLYDGKFPNEDRLRIDMGLPNSMLRDILEQTKREVVEDLKKQINKRIFEDRYSYYGSQKDKLQEWVKDMIKEEVLAANKDLIIEKAAKELASSMSRSKVVREQFMEQLEESLEETE